MDHKNAVVQYYRRTESRVGYRVVLGGTRHFGWYSSERTGSRWRFPSALYRMEMVLGRRLQLAPGAEVLDAGCGEGKVARTIAEEYGLRVTGIDLVPESIDLATNMVTSTAGLRSRLSFAVGDYHSLAFDDSSFDGVYTMETFVHASDPEAVLANFFRVLRPGGVAVMFEYSSAPKGTVSSQAYDALQEVCDIAAMPGWMQLTHGRLEELAAAAGFYIESSEDVTSNMLPMLEAFDSVARLPYYILSLLDQQTRSVNMMSAVELNRHRDVWRYNIYVLRKPESGSIHVVV